MYKLERKGPVAITPLQYTPLDTLTRVYETVRAAYSTGSTRPLAWRLHQLKQVGYMIQENEDRWAAALASDLGRHHNEAQLADIVYVKNEVNEMLAGLPKWVKPERVKTTMAWAAANPTIYHEPKGTVLILGTWNYPLALALGPLLGAIAGGNSAVLKPAEQSQAVAALMAELVPQYLDPEAFQIVNGAVDQTQALLKFRWDHIFYTGSGNVGRIIARAAAEHLTPVTLELGGKSPAVIFDDADLTTAGRRLMWGKFLNAGQTCIAPDYVLAPAHLQGKLIASMKSALDEFYSSHTSPTESDQYCKIINSNHFSRLRRVLDGTKGEIVIGGQTDASQNKIAVTVLRGVTDDDSTMAGEIFGPILPILTVRTQEEAIQYINSRDIPLAVYVFTKNKKNMDSVRNATRSGQILFNDVLVQFSIPGLPFGGTGHSGLGNYHGHHSFLTFTHERASATVSPWMEPLVAARYPPYTPGKLKMLKLFTGSSIPGKSKPNGGKFRATEKTGILAWIAGRTVRGKLLSLLLVLFTAWWARKGSWKL